MKSIKLITKFVGKFAWIFMRVVRENGGSGSAKITILHCTAGLFVNVWEFSFESHLLVREFTSLSQKATRHLSVGSAVNRSQKILLGPKVKPSKTPYFLSRVPLLRGLFSRVCLVSPCCKVCDLWPLFPSSLPQTTWFPREGCSLPPALTTQVVSKSLLLSKSRVSYYLNCPVDINPLELDVRVVCVEHYIAVLGVGVCQSLSWSCSQ